jgi:hypothetical protein
VIAWLLNEPNPIRYLARRAMPDSIRARGRSVMRSMSLGTAPRLDPDLRRRLTLTIMDDIRELETLIGRDLSHWRADAAAR